MLLFCLFCGLFIVSADRQGGCALVIFVHVPKTGGCTQYSIFEKWHGFVTRSFRLSDHDHATPGRKNSALDAAVPREYTQLMHYLTTLEPQDLKGGDHKFAVELHRCHGLRKALADITLARSTFEAQGCPAVVFTTLRQPVAAAQSWQGMKNHSAVAPGRECADPRWLSSNGGIVANMQSKWLWFEGAEPKADNAGICGVKNLNTRPTMNTVESAALAGLLDDLDFVGITENFDLTNFGVGELLGLSRAQLCLSIGTRRGNQIGPNVRKGLSCKGVLGEALSRLLHDDLSAYKKYHNKFLKRFDGIDVEALPKAIGESCFG